MAHRNRMQKAFSKMVLKYQQVVVWVQEYILLGRTKLKDLHKIIQMEL